MSPIYEDENHTREELDKIRRQSKCKVCGERLDLFLDRDYNVFLACHNWSQSRHDGIEREYQPSPQETDEPTYEQHLRRGVAMEKALGLEKTRALIKYEGVLSLTKPQAEEILLAIYGDAPKQEITRAVLLCASYQLNPLMKHVFLIPFNKGRPNESWATVIGIKAKRLLASRRGSYSYVGDTPRVMTEEEKKTTFGTIDTDRIWVITKLKDPATNAEAVGYGFWLTKDTCYGIEKGNTPFNMAAIRSESQALDRLRPGEMPVGVEVVPEEAVEGEWKEVPGAKGQEVSIPKPKICRDCPTWDECQGSNQEDCERRGKEPSKASTKDETLVTEDDLAQLNKLMSENNVSASQLGAYMNKDKGWNIKVTTELKKYQLNELLEAFKKGKE